MVKKRPTPKQILGTLREGDTRRIPEASRENGIADVTFHC